MYTLLIHLFATVGFILLFSDIKTSIKTLQEFKDSVLNYMNTLNKDYKKMRTSSNNGDNENENENENENDFSNDENDFSNDENDFSDNDNDNVNDNDNDNTK
jgi:hypothetical protein